MVGDKRSRNRFGLNPMQDEFARHMAKSHNGTQSAIAAGYAPKNAKVTASKLLSKSNVMDAVNHYRSKVARKIELDAAMVLEGLLVNARAGQEMTPIINRDGDVVGERRADLAASNVAWSWLGKHLKLFTDRIEHADVNAAQEYLTEVLKAVFGIVKDEKTRTEILLAIDKIHPEDPRNDSDD